MECALCKRNKRRTRTVCAVKGQNNKSLLSALVKSASLRASGIALGSARVELFVSEGVFMPERKIIDVFTAQCGKRNILTLTAQHGGGIGNLTVQHDDVVFI